MPRTRVGRGAGAGLFAAVVAVGLASVWVASRPPVIALGADSPQTLALLVASGISLGAAGSLALVVYPREPFGPLVLVASVAWFASTWTSPGVGMDLLFTIGLVLASATAPLVGHALLGYGASLTSRMRWIVGAGYLACVLLLGLVPAITGAATAACAACPHDLVGLVDAADAGAAATRAGLVLAAFWALVVVIAGGRRVIRASSATRRLIVPVVLPGAVAIAAFGLDAARSIPRGLIGVDPVDTAAWAVQAIALIALSAGSWVRVARGRRTRNAVAEIVLELARGTEAGRLQERLRALLGDPQLVLAYPAGDGRLVDATGVAAVLPGGPNRRSTPLVRDGEVVAVVDHRSGLEQDTDRMTEIATAAGLALEHERLLAESRARLTDVRASRARVVEATDRERVRLERDLHDGAQQRLVGLALAIRVARSAGGRTTDDPGDAELATAEAEVRAAIADVREIAHGIYPAVLADLGLGPAVGALAEEGTIPIDVEAMPGVRFASAVESTACFVIAEAPGRTGARRMRVRGWIADESLRLYLALEGAAAGAPADLTELEDRVGALDGTIASFERDGLLVIEVAIPCAS